ncbi:Uncharacterised protein [Vibrio cholerae]|nr:Uncharacterised protein [Vibrio cholerae]CSD33968.1 Uncharacterised protein [Vibrio cholerae]
MGNSRENRARQRSAAKIGSLAALILWFLRLAVVPLVENRRPVRQEMSQSESRSNLLYVNVFP